ncbi:MAG: hypothetical protein ACOX2O_00220 [Bdellovibrionota bacterium]|jgi:hypothetical protein
MDLQSLLKDSAQKDPTWDVAREIVAERMVMPNSLLYLIRSAWNGNIDITEFIRLVAFSGLNASCLLTAAELRTSGETPPLPLLEKAIDLLGIRFSGLVLAINATVRAILITKPPTGWRKLLEDMMTDIHIGYCFGNRSNELGTEGGALVGFSKMAGLGILMAHDPKSYRDYVALQRQSIKISSEGMLELFGCEPYQVSAMLLQSLGFGVHAAVGAACGLSKLNTDQIELNYTATKWRAAFQWIDALREGKDYPAELTARHAFPALKPPQDNTKKNIALETLYVDVVRVRQKGSHWMWHLPRPDYNATRDIFGL